MTSRTLRRRPHHGELDGKRHENLESLNEPLLGVYEQNETHSNGYSHGDGDIRDDDRKKERLHWTFLFSNLIAQWAQWLANIILGSGSLLGRLLPHPFATHNGLNRKSMSLHLNPLQEERLRNLQLRLKVPFDGNLLEHQDALMQLWRLAYPGRELPPLKSELWKEMGWQGNDPSTDFRGGGLISLENLIFFAKKYPESFQRLLHKQDGNRSEWEYPFAVASINISFMLVQMLDLHSGKPSTEGGIRFLEFLREEDEMAFDDLYCVAFRMMDAQWLAKHASYMQFNEVLKSTRIQLERELALEDVSSVKDLPMYNLLNR
ncbi:hypothetical protein IFM89_021016 [Coptis chinensis]|uniref:ELMO domain-containing protein n=1 Tax=Coptis chinensis TaxID=261450 RepID=A0A835LFY4_9MAGN|nr:hypothetical protein IFM89_021016 [Coptis chinensis]